MERQALLLCGSFEDGKRDAAQHLVFWRLCWLSRALHHASRARLVVCTLEELLRTLA